jgi:hypothetical protein
VVREEAAGDAFYAIISGLAEVHRRGEKVAVWSRHVVPRLVEHDQHDETDDHRGDPRRYQDQGHECADHHDDRDRAAAGLVDLNFLDRINHGSLNR